MSALIAIVEDEPALAKLLDDYLQKDEFKTRVFNDGTQALESLREDEPDLVLLDLMLPGTDGLTICRELRKHSQVPIIMMTARVEEIDRLLGLEIGADDYICKPYSPREVVARAKAVLRRASSNKATTGQDGSDDTGGAGLVLNELAATVTVNEQVVSLTAVELNLLEVLCQSPARIFSRNQLMRRIYPDNRVVSDRTIDSHIKKLRQKIEKVDTDFTYIHSVYGIGYKYEPVENDAA